MGLDQYAYVAARAGQRTEFYETGTWNRETGQLENATVSEPKEIAYWRKHPNLQGWMEQLWINKRDHNPEDDPTFNGVELELTWDDLVALEQAVTNNSLPHTEGFFFGSPADEYYRAADLEFIGEAKFYLLNGVRVFYNSSW